MASTIMSYHMMGMASMSGMKSMNSQAEVVPQDMPMMDHSHHNMSGDSATSADSTEDCCNTICNCFTGGCTSIAALIKNVGNSPLVDNAPKILSFSRLALSQQPKSLYRPPILS